jgi:hypothetical protein
MVNQLLHKLFFSSTASASNSKSNFTVAAFMREIYMAAGQMSRAGEISAGPNAPWREFLEIFASAH